MSERELEIENGDNLISAGQTSPSEGSVTSAGQTESDYGGVSYGDIPESVIELIKELGSTVKLVNQDLGCLEARTETVVEGLEAEVRFMQEGLEGLEAWVGDIDVEGDRRLVELEKNLVEVNHAGDKRITDLEEQINRLYVSIGVLGVFMSIGTVLAIISSMGVL